MCMRMPSVAARRWETKETIWLFAISVLMLVGMIAFAIVIGFVPYGSPAEVIKAFYSACNSDNFSVAEKFLVPDRLFSSDIDVIDGGLRGICDAETKQGHLQRIEVLHEEVRGEEGRVRYKLYYADGSTIEDSQGLIMRHGVWKIVP